MSEEDQKGNFEDIPEGMVKKKRKIKGKRRTKQSKKENSEYSLFSQGKELLRRIQHDEDEQGHVGVKEQLERLRGEGEEALDPDELWGVKKKSSTWIWVSLIGLIIPLVVIGLLVSLLNQKTDDLDELLVPELVALSDQKLLDDNGAHHWFHEESVEMMDEALTILRRFNEARHPSEVAEYLRPSPRRGKNPIILKNWGPSVEVATRKGTAFQLKTAGRPEADRRNDTGYLQLDLQTVEKGEKRVFFVYEDEKLLLDWDATTAWSQVAWGDLIDQKPRSGTLVRALIEKKASYDSEYRNVSHSGYILSDGSDGNYLFAFIPLNSDENRKMDEELKTLLGYGKLITSLKKNLPVTVKIRYGGPSGQGERFEIVDYLHEGWVRP